MKSPDAEREAQIRETYGGKPWSDPMFLLRLLDEARAVAIEDAAQRLDAAYRDCIERASAIPDFETAANWKRAANTYAQAAQYVRALADKI